MDSTADTSCDADGDTLVTVPRLVPSLEALGDSCYSCYSGSE